MNYSELTIEEKELIKNYRMNKSELIIKNISKDSAHYTEYNQIKFNIQDDIIKMNTVNARFDKKLGHNDSSSGFYEHNLTIEDIMNIQKYFDYFLGNKIKIKDKIKYESNN